MSFLAGCYDVIVIGAGHAGCEAALAGARLGFASCCSLPVLIVWLCCPAIRLSGTGQGTYCQGN